MNTARFARWVLASSLVLCTALTLHGTGLLRPTDVNAEGNCSLKTIKGTWLFQAEGVVIEDGQVVPYVEAGVWTLDGKGQTTGIISGSINGVSFATREVTRATYTHVGNCVYSVEDDLGFQLDMYTTPGSKIMTYYAAGFSGLQIKQ